MRHAVRQCATLIATRVTQADRSRQERSLSTVKVIHTLAQSLCRLGGVIHISPELSPIFQVIPNPYKPSSLMTTPVTTTSYDRVNE